MLLFGAVYVVVFMLYATLWQKREAEYVREHLVENFYKISETDPKNEAVLQGGVVYVMKNMDSPIGKEARSQFRNERMSELVIAGIMLVLSPIGIIAISLDLLPY